MVHIGTYISPWAHDYHALCELCKTCGHGTSVSSDLWCACMVSKVTNERTGQRSSAGAC